MPVRQPSTQSLDAADAQAQWKMLIEQVSRGHRRVIVEEHGIPVVAIVSAADLERWRRLDDERARQFSALDDSQAAFAGLPDEEVEREVEKALTEVRADRRRQARRTAPGA